MTVPDDLRAQLEAPPRARRSFEELDSRNRYAILYRLQDAKKAETRQRRLEKFVRMLEAGETLHQRSATGLSRLGATLATRPAFLTVGDSPSAPKVATTVLLRLRFNETPEEVHMHPVDPSGGSLTGEVPLPIAVESLEGSEAPSRRHLVVVTTRALDGREVTSAGTTLRTRFWHPRDRRWSENDFESLEHARCLFVDESGWVLRQEQALDAPLAQEWIFEAHRIDFTRSSKEQILREIGMTPDSVNRLLEQVEHNQPDQ